MSLTKNVTHVIQSRKGSEFFLDETDVLWEKRKNTYYMKRPIDIGGVEMYRLGDKIISRTSLLSLAKEQ